MVTIKQELGGGLGYKVWLELEGYGPMDYMLMPDGKRVAHNHPSIVANEEHAKHIKGCIVGMRICGVRWFDDYKGQDVINPPKQ